MRHTLLALLLAGAVTISCSTATPLPSNLPGDVTAEVDCIASKLISGDTVLASLAVCVGGDLKIAADIVEWLLSQTSMLAKMPPASPAALRANVHTFRLTLPQ